MYASDVTATKNAANSQDNYQEYVSSSDDEYLQMKVQNSTYWSSLDDYNYWNNANYIYSNGFYNPYSMYYNPYSSYSMMGMGFGSLFYNPFMMYGMYPMYYMGSSYYNFYAARPGFMIGSVAVAKNYIPAVGLRTLASSGKTNSSPFYLKGSSAASKSSGSNIVKPVSSSNWNRPSATSSSRIGSSFSSGSGNMSRGRKN